MTKATQEKVLKFNHNFEIYHNFEKASTICFYDNINGASLFV